MAQETKSRLGLKHRLPKLVFAALLLLWLTIGCSSAESAVPSVTATADSLSPAFFFDETDARLIALDIRKDGQTFSLARGADGKWMLLSPQGTLPEQGQVEAAISQLRALPRLATGLRLSPADVGIGSQAQAAYVSLRFADGQESAFWVGDSTPSGRGYYLLRPNGDVDIVEKDSLDVFFRFLAFLEAD